MSTIDDEIKKSSRKWLSEFVGFSTFENLMALRDILDAIADVIDDQLERMWKAKENRLYQRPPVATVKKFETLLRTYVTSDINPEERWTEVKFWIQDVLLPELRRSIHEIVNGPAKKGPKESVYTITKRRFEKSFRVLLRRPPGRKDDSKKIERYAHASRVREEKNWSFKKLAQHFLPAEYAKSPRNAASMMCQGIKRYRTKTAVSGEPIPKRPPTGQRPTVH